MIRQRGFTLLEIMVALAIVGFLIMGYLRSVSQSITVVDRAENKTFAHWIALNRLTEMRLDQAPPEVGETDGEVEFDDRFWRWDARVTETGVDNLYRVDVAVAFDDTPDDPVTSLTAFLGPPVMSGGSIAPWAREPLENAR